MPIADLGLKNSEGLITIDYRWQTKLISNQSIWNRKRNYVQLDGGNFTPEL